MIFVPRNEVYMLVRFNDPVTGLPHIVESDDIFLKDETTILVHVNSLGMTVSLEFEYPKRCSFMMDELFTHEKLSACCDDITASIEFQEDKKKEPDIDIEMYGINLSALLDEDGNLDESFLLDGLFGDNSDEDEEDDAYYDE